MKLSDVVAPVKVAMMDAAQKASIRRLNVLKNDCPCKPGCSSCCSRLIHISVAEALIIYNYLQKGNSWTSIRETALSQYKLASITSDIAWFKMNSPCAILDPTTKTCRAYSVRPTPCSVHFVTSNPDICDPWSVSDGEFKKADFPKIHEKFMDVVSRELSGRGVLELRLPMPAALLFAEKIQTQNNLTAEQIVGFISSEIA